MAHNGYFSFAGSEIINAERTVAYAAALTPGLRVDDCERCQGLRYLVNRRSPFGPLRFRFGRDVEDQTRYRSPLLDKPDWYDDNDPDTWGFAGIYPLSVSGIEDGGKASSVTELNQDGGFLGAGRRASKEVKFTGLLIGDSDRSLDAGMRWLRRALEGSDCGDGSQCFGDDLCYLSACPECAPLSGIDSTALAAVRASGTVPGDSDWQEFGGAWVPDHDAGTSTYTSSLTAVTRTNLIPNPSFHPNATLTELRRNLVTNPSFAIGLNDWTVNGSGTTARDQTTHPSTTIVSMKVTPSSGTMSLEYEIAAAPGDELSWGFSHKGDFNVYGGLFFYDGSDTNLGNGLPGGILPPGTPIALASSTWTPYHAGTGAAPAGTTKAILTLEVDYDDSPGGSNWFAATSIEAMSALSIDYFDGNTPNDGGMFYSWTGAQYLSESIVSGRTIDGWTQTASTGAMVVDLDGSADLYGEATFVSDDFTTVGSQFYAARVKVYSDGGCEVTLTLTIGVGTTAATKTMWVPPGEEVVILAPASANTVATTAHLTVSTTLGDIATVSEAMVEPVPSGGVTGPYFDGDTASTGDEQYVWSGEPYASSSIATLTANYASEYLEHSPFGAVCDNMTFSVDFGGPLTTETLLRTNYISNPAYEVLGSSETVRRNLGVNPTGHDTTDAWTAHYETTPTATPTLASVADTTGLADDILGVDGVTSWVRQTKNEDWETGDGIVIGEVNTDYSMSSTDGTLAHRLDRRVEQLRRQPVPGPPRLL